MAKERENTNGIVNESVINCDQLPEVTNIQPMIRIIRGKQVMLDRDLSAIYGVETKRLNEQVKRNIERFPDDFMFQLTKEEFEEWKSQFATSKSITMGARKLPYAFTENGVAMLSTSFPNSHRSQYSHYESLCVHAPLYCDQCPIIPKA